MQSLHILFASTSGHTEYVVGIIGDVLKAADIAVSSCRVELATAADFSTGDALLLASGTWNTGGIEGQLNPHMHAFVWGPAKDVDLKGRKVAIVALGDDRYKYTARAGEHLKTFVEKHGGTILGEPLKIINEPYGQEEKIQKWGQSLAHSLIR